MTRDLVVFVGLVSSFSTWLTAHVTIAFGIARRPPRARALAAFVVPPLALYWSIRERMKVRAALACLGLVGYGAMRWLARG